LGTLVRPVLILGGTAEARELAQLLIDAGFAPVTSLAGSTEDPILPPGKIRKGGFGSALGMVRYMSGAFIVAVADASHPFAAKISVNAAQAAQRAGIPYLRLERPPWSPQDGDQWIEAQSVANSASLIPTGSRALVTTGRKEIAPFLMRQDVTGIIRTIDQPVEPLPENWALLQDRPPYSLEQERALLAREGITVLVTKNAGGNATRAKLDAAREKKIPVIIVKRPSKPEAPVFWPAAELAQHLARAFKLDPTPDLGLSSFRVPWK
jgi:precorrin-6A/cobalt-precorrin-6A reductase